MMKIMMTTTTVMMMMMMLRKIPSEIVDFLLPPANYQSRELNLAIVPRMHLGGEREMLGSKRNEVYSRNTIIFDLPLMKNCLQSIRRLLSSLRLSAAGAFNIILGAPGIIEKL